MELSKLAELEPTNCCALSQLVAINDDTLDDIRNGISRNGYEYDDMIPSTVFAVTLPQERALIKRLKGLGFKRVFTFPRRPGLTPGTLTFWLRNYRENSKPHYRVLRPR